MSLNEPEKPKKGWGCLQWGAVLIIGGLLITLFVPVYGGITPKALQMKGGSNCRQIIGLLLTYAADYNGKFPDADLNATGLTSNAVFRELVKEGLVQDESIFSCPTSIFIPDGQIGTAPDYKQALEPGENHWMMVAGLENRSDSHYPVVMESAVDTTWPPRWLPHQEPSALMKFLGDVFPSSPPLRPRGGSWPGSLILVGHLDASVSTVKLHVKESYAHYPASLAKPPLKLLDIEEKP
jgi:hypothetical protein